MEYSRSHQGLFLLLAAATLLGPWKSLHQTHRKECRLLESASRQGPATNCPVRNPDSLQLHEQPVQLMTACQSPRMVYQDLPEIGPGLESIDSGIMGGCRFSSMEVLSPSSAASSACFSAAWSWLDSFLLSRALFFGPRGFFSCRRPGHALGLLSSARSRFFAGLPSRRDML